MARIRTIKPEFWTSEQVVDCRPLTRLLFIGMWTFADDAGRLPASARRLKMQVFPADDLSANDVLEMVRELCQAGLVLEYESEGERFWQVTGWDRHQRVDKPTVKFPAPSSSPRGALADSSPSIRRALDEPSTTPPGALAEASPTEWNGMEWNGEEKKGTHSSPCSVLGGQTPEPATGRGVCSPSAPVPNRKPHNPPASDDELRPLFDAYCRGSGQGLAWRVQAILPTEQIATHTRDPAAVERVAAFYRATLTDGKPASFARFAAEFDRWRAEADRKRAGGKAPKRDWARQGRCSLHPGEDITTAPCELCAAQERARARAREGAAA